MRIFVATILEVVEIPKQTARTSAGSRPAKPEIRNEMKRRTIWTNISVITFMKPGMWDTKLLKPYLICLTAWKNYCKSKTDASVLFFKFPQTQSVCSDLVEGCRFC